MRRIAALGCALAAALLLPAARGQETRLTSTGASPLAPSMDQMPRPTSPLPITLDLSLPNEAAWLANINAPAGVPPALAAEAVSTMGQPGAACLDTRICNCVRPCDIFHKGQTEIEVLTGALFAPIGVGPTGPNMLFLPQLVRYGYMVNNPHQDRWAKGTLEAIFEATTMPIVNGPGNILVGGALYGRWNFMRFPSNHFVPYLEMGGGGSYSDSYKFRPSNLSTGFEFILHTGLGAHYLLNSCWAITGEFDYYHFSNAGINRGNFGVNALGGVIGITRFLR